MYIANYSDTALVMAWRIGGGDMMHHVEVKLFRSPRGSHVATLPADVLAGVSATTVTPGGYGVLSLDIATDDQGVPVVPRDWCRAYGYAHVVGYLDGAPAFEGRLTTWQERGLWVPSIPISGYYFAGLNEAPFTGSGLSATLTAGALLKAVFAECGALIRAGGRGQWTNPATVQTIATHAGKMPSQIVTDILDQGDSTGRLVDLWVYEDRIAWLVPRTPPARAHYRIDAGDLRIERTPSLDGAVGQLAITYTDAATGLPASLAALSDSAYLAAYDVQRSRTVNAGTFDTIAAQQFQAAELRRLARPAVPTTISLSNWEGLPRPDGSLAPFAQIRAGEWVEEVDDGGEALLHPIISTDLDWLNGTGTLTCGETPLTFPDWLAVTQEHADALRSAGLRRH